eukprot:PhF_6_TR930/c0_g2_i6/m.1622
MHRYQNICTIYSCMTASLSILLASVLFLGNVNQVSADPILNTCYLYFADVTDFGYTFNHNQGRRLAHAQLHKEGFEILSDFMSNAFFGNHTQIIDSFVYKGCNLIVATAPGFHDAFWVAARKYRNITFAIHNAFGEISSEPNVIVYGVREYQPWYLAGVAAATQTKTNSIAFIAAWDNVAAVMVQVNAFALGAQSIKPNITVHLIPMQNWYWPDGDEEAARAAVSTLNADVVAHYSDSAQSAMYVATLPKAQRVFSVHIHTNGIDFIGESVLTSCYADWSVMYLNMTRTLIARNGQPYGANLWFDMKSGAAMVGEPSPISDFVVDSVMTKARSTSVDTIWCNRDIYDTQGILRFSKIAGCVSDDALRSQTYIIRGITHHESYRMGNTVCPPGTFFTQDTGGRGGTLRTQCTPCPENTYAPTSLYQRCLDCEYGVPAGSSVCKSAKPKNTLPEEVVAGVSVAASVVGIAFIVFVIVIWSRHRSQQKSLEYAPKKTDDRTTVLFIDIQSSTMLWAQHPVEMSRAIRKYHDVVTSLVAKHRCYEVKKVVDSVMVVCSNPCDGVRFALDVQRNLAVVDWKTTVFDDFYERNSTMRSGNEFPPFESNQGAMSRLLWGGLRARIGMDCGHCEVEEVLVGQSKQYEYMGVSVTIAEQVERMAHGGQVIVTERVWGHMLSNLNMSSSEYCPTPLGAFPGVTTKPLRLYQLVPPELSSRKFPVPRNFLSDGSERSPLVHPLNPSTGATTRTPRKNTPGSPQMATDSNTPSEQPRSTAVDPRQRTSSFIAASTMQAVQGVVDRLLSPLSGKDLDYVTE